MQAPASPSKCLRYPVTTCVVLLAVAATAWRWSGADIDLFLSDRGNCLLEPWRLLAPVFFHGGVLHLLFDVWWLWTLGAIVEAEFGHIATLGIYFILAVGSTAAEVAVLHGGIGLSGIVYGLFGLLWVLSRTDPRFHDAIDLKIIELMTGWFLLCVVLKVADVWDIALVAHAVGCLLGALLGWIVSVRKFGPRLWRSAVLAATFLLCLAGATNQLRHYVNLASDDGSALAEQGQAALEAGDLPKAIDRYDRATNANPKVHAWWTELGHAYQRAGRMDEASKALDNAARLRDHRPIAE
jgi:membrane associated rhomboid family serine protease